MVFDHGPATPYATDRGFTGHEHLDDVGIIHMNGRLFDPLTGRFLQADPFIEDPSHLQSFNRYSYVSNNPLNATDPSGYFSLRKLVKFAFVAAVGFYTGQWIGGLIQGGAGVGSALVSIGTDLVGNVVVTGLSASGSALAGAAGGFAAGVAGGGGIRGGLNGAFSGGVFGAIGGLGAANDWSKAQYVAAHAAGGCVTSAAAGGDCGSGAASAFVGKLITVNTPASWNGGVGQFAMTVVGGGLGSVAAGGKFENGATTAAFGYLFNQLMTDRGKALQTIQGEGVMPGDRTGLFPGAHTYLHLDRICDAGAAGCSVDSVFNGVRRYPAPGADGSARVETGMVTNVSIPGMLVGTDHVLHEVNRSANRVFNLTLGDHVLNPGWVARSVLQVNGGVYVHTYGIGSGSNPLNVNGNQTIVNQVWGGTNNNIRRCVSAGSC